MYANIERQPSRSAASPIPLEGGLGRALKHNAGIMRSRLGEETPPGTHTADCPGLRFPAQAPHNLRYVQVPAGSVRRVFGMR
jgi:hypothetical protein